MNTTEIRDRDQHRCARCGSGDQLHVHHRVRRSQGGRDDSCNLITLCAACHRWVHANPYAARKLGLLLPHHSDPAKIPVDHILWPSGPVLLGAQLDFVLWDAELR